MASVSENDSLKFTSKVFSHVEGIDSNANDVIIFKRDNETPPSSYNLIYFGGDIQDYLDEMKKSITSRKFTQWDLINTGNLLLNKFNSRIQSNANANVFVVRADYFHLKCFANYSNFLPCTDFGVPINDEDLAVSRLDDPDDISAKVSSSISSEKLATLNRKLRCWSHLQKVFTNSIEKHNNDLKENQSQIDATLPIILCGFSKGCVVLNQLCKELEDFEENIDVTEETRSFLKQIRHTIWLDGGHSGTKNSWITKEEIILLIKKLNWSCYVYVTPYQIKSPKYWAIEEYIKFVDLLKSSNVNMKHVYYFEEKEDDFDVDIHFEILKVFDSFLI